MKELDMKTNHCWNSEQKPFVSLITPVFNRREELQRCFASVKKQTYSDFEYIVVNDGSTENIDDVVERFMEEADVPVMYIKKENGGVHTARNMGVKHTRGEMIHFLDSDDEELENGLEVLVRVWEQLPNKEAYAEIKARCLDQNGDLDGAAFPDDINSYPMPKRLALANRSGGSMSVFVRRAS